MYAARGVQNPVSTGQSLTSRPPSSFRPSRKEQEATKHILRSRPSLPNLTTESKASKAKGVAIPTTQVNGLDKEAMSSTHRSTRSVDPTKVERPPSRGTTPTRQTKEEIERQKAKKGTHAPTHEPSSSWGSFRFRRKESRESLVEDNTPIVPTVSTASGSPNQPSSIRRLRSLGFLRRKNSVSATSSPSSTSLVSQPAVTTTASGSSHGHSNSSNSTSSLGGSHVLPTTQLPNHTQIVSASTVFPSLKSGTTFNVTKVVNSSLAGPSSSSDNSTTNSFARPLKANPSIRRSISLYESNTPRGSSGVTRQLSGSSRPRQGIKRPVVLPSTTTTVVARTPCTYDVSHRRPLRPRSSSLPLDSALVEKLKALSSLKERHSPSSSLLPPYSESATNTPPSTSSSMAHPSTPRTQNRYAAVYRPPPPLDANGQARPGHPKPALSLSMPNGVSIIEPLRASGSPTAAVGNGNMKGNEKNPVTHTNSNFNVNANITPSGNANLNNTKSTTGSAGLSGSSSLAVPVAPNSPFLSLATPATPHTPHTPHTPYSAYTLAAPLASPYSLVSPSPSSGSMRPPPRAPVPVSPGASPEQRGTKPLPPLSALSPPVSAALSARFESSSHGHSSPRLGPPSTPHSARSTPTPIHPLTPTVSGSGNGNAHGLLGLHSRSVATTTSATTTANASTNAIAPIVGGSKVPTNQNVPVRPADQLNGNSNISTTTTTTTKGGMDIAEWTANVNAHLKINVSNLHGANGPNSPSGTKRTSEANGAAPSTASIVNERIGERRTIYRAPPTLELAPISPSTFTPMRRPSLPILSTTSPSSLLSPASLLPHPHSREAGRSAATTSGKGMMGAVTAPSPEPSVMEDDDILWRYFEKRGLTTSSSLPGRSASASAVLSRPPPPPPPLPLPPVPTARPANAPSHSHSNASLVSTPTTATAIATTTPNTNTPRKNTLTSLRTPPQSTGVSPSSPYTPFTPASTSNAHATTTTLTKLTAATAVATATSTSKSKSTETKTRVTTTPPSIITTGVGSGKSLRRPRHTVSHSSSAALPSPSAQSVKSTFLPTQSVFLQSQTLYLPSSPLSPPPPSTFLPSPGGTDALETFPLTPFTPNFFSRESTSKDEEVMGPRHRAGGKRYSDAESQLLPLSPPISPRANEV